MAEGFALAHAPGSVMFQSAGTKPGKAVHPLAVRAMGEVGIDIRNQRPKALADVPAPDLVVAVCASAAAECPVLPGIQMERWNLPDPANAAGTDQERLRVFRGVRDAIEERVLELIGRLGSRG